MARSIVFLSDFGYRNEWVGICHAVMNRVSPESRIVDLSHGIPPLDVAGGALLLADSLPYVAEDAVILAVVDPSVGRDDDLAVRTKNGRLFVGPDNGLLAPSWRACGGVAEAVPVSASDVILEPVSPSLHARDVLAPAAAHLAAGRSLAELGSAVDKASITELHLPEPSVERGKISCEVLDLNRFGNVQLNVRRSDLATAGLESASELCIEGHTASVFVRQVSTYADLTEGEWGVMVDPRGWLSVIRGNPANAAEGLGVEAGDLLWVSAAT